MAWKDRLTTKINTYIDNRFDTYRGQLSTDLSSGLAALAGLIAVWTLFIVLVVFIGIALALWLGVLLRPWLPQTATVWGFSGIALLFIGLAYYVFLHRKRLIETPVYRITSRALRAPETPDTEAEALPLISTEDDTLAE